jgi:hypothetical protein
MISFANPANPTHRVHYDFEYNINADQEDRVNYDSVRA